MKVEKGAKVKVVDPKAPNYGRIGIVIGLHPHIAVRFEGLGWGEYTADELEAVEEAS